MDKSDGSLLLLAFLLIATSTLSLNGSRLDYETHTPYQGGVLTVAKIVDIKEHQRGRSITRRITVNYSDQNSRAQQAILEGNGDHWLKTGQAIEISYVPGSYRTARWPSGRESDSAYNRWNKIFSGALFAGILCLLAIPVKRLFRANNVSAGTDVGAKSSFVMTLSYGRVLLNLVVFTSFFGLMYVTVYHYLFYLTGLSVVTSQILLMAVSSLFLLAIWNAVRPAIGHHPLVLTRRGFSVYNSGEILWREVTEIAIRRHRSSYSLHFNLTNQSKVEPKQRIFGKLYEPQRIVLSLESSNWTTHELREELIDFALRGRDDEAAVAFRRSAETCNDSSGPIKWPETMSDYKEQNVSSKRSKTTYMSNGFHRNNQQL